MRREQISRALIAAKCDADKVVQAFDEMDRDGNKLITYSEFRYYVATVQRNYSLITVDNFSPTKGRAGQESLDDINRKNKWRPVWDRRASYRRNDKLQKQDAIDLIKETSS